MKSDYTTNSRYITHTITFWKVGRIHFLSSGVKGLTLFISQCKCAHQFQLSNSIPLHSTSSNPNGRAEIHLPGMFGWIHESGQSALLAQPLPPPIQYWLMHTTDALALSHSPSRCARVLELRSAVFPRRLDTAGTLSWKFHYGQRLAFRFVRSTINSK